MATIIIRTLYFLYSLNILYSIYIYILTSVCCRYTHVVLWRKQEESALCAVIWVGTTWVGVVSRCGEWVWWVVRCGEWVLRACFACGRAIPGFFHVPLRSASPEWRFHMGWCSAGGATKWVAVIVLYGKAFMLYTGMLVGGVTKLVVSDHAISPSTHAM